MPSNNPNLKFVSAGNMGLLEPNERLKVLSNYSNSIEIDRNVPPQRYYRSGLEMVRMANVYMEEGNLENAYVLYLKFMTLFIEKIRKHPEYASVPVGMKATNSNKLREVLPKAEKLKKDLLEKYTIEYNRYLEEQKRKDHEMRKRAAESKSKERTGGVISTGNATDHRSWSKIEPVPDIGSVRYPDDEESSTYGSQPFSKPNPKPSASESDFKGPIIPVTPITSKSKPESLVIAGPTPQVDRTLKPTSLLSPSVQQKIGNRDVIIPSKLVGKFLCEAQKNTFNNIETCGVLAGKLEHDQLIITHVIISKQDGTSDTCTTMNEEEIFDFQDQHNLITLGWIHTHPSQTAFLSSIDVHTQCSYQIMMPEAIAIVCAPKYHETGVFVLTLYGLELISECRQTGFHPHPRDPPIFCTADHTRFDHATPVEIIDLR